MRFFALALLLFAFVGCSKKISFETKAEIIEAPPSSISSSVARFTKNIVTSTFRKEKSIGLKFKICDNSFLEQMRISDLAWSQYKDQDSIPITVLFCSQGWFEIYMSDFNEDSPYRLRRSLSKALFKDLYKNCSH